MPYAIKEQSKCIDIYLLYAFPSDALNGSFLPAYRGDKRENCSGESSQYCVSIVNANKKL